MDSAHYDLAIVGGGLAGGLIALAVSACHPHRRIALIEAGTTLGGHHRWSWFSSDLDQRGEALLGHFRQTRWNDGYSVRFPGYERVLSAGYRSLSSADFDTGLRAALDPRQVTIMTGCSAAALAPGKVAIEGRAPITAEAVIDCRSAVMDGSLEGGWQVFLGQTWRTEAPHGLRRPIIMDATVEQHGAYRFVYVLPLGPDRVFIEDTYYADDPSLDAAVLRQRIAAYAAAQGWRGTVEDEETGVLPVITGGTPLQPTQGLGIGGARGGFVHPLTSYTMPMAVATALAIADHGPAPGLAEMLAARALRHWQVTGFYRLLGRMLFGAARPELRWRIFSRFYRLPEGLIERFYAADSTAADKLRVLAGKPPVPIGGALRTLLGKGARLVHEGRP